MNKTSIIRSTTLGVCAAMVIAFLAGNTALPSWAKGAHGGGGHGAAGGHHGGSFAKNHPRRAQVLGRNGRTNGRLNADKGHLGGHYNQLKSENHSIHQQERSDAKANGGHITKGEQHQLNQEHNQLNQQIRQDHK